MKKLMWILTIIGSIIGGLLLFVTITSSEGAPQEAAGAAIALCFAVLPYCMARAIAELGKD